MKIYAISSLNQLDENGLRKWLENNGKTIDEVDFEKCWLRVFW